MSTKWYYHFIDISKMIIPNGVNKFNSYGKPLANHSK